MAGSFRYLDGNAGLRQSYAKGSFRNLTATINAGGFKPAAPSDVIGAFNPLQAAIHGLSGTTGQITGAFRKIDGMLGKPNQGKMTGSFRPFNANIYANPPGVVFVDSYAAASTDVTVQTLLLVAIDSTGVAVDAWLVNVTADTDATVIDSSGGGAWDWIVKQIDTVKFDSRALAHDLMAMGIIASLPGDPTYGIGGSGVDPSSGGTAGQGSGSGSGGGGTSGGSAGSGGGTAGGGVGAGATEGVSIWVYNVDSNATSRYENYAYQSLATWQGRLFGTQPDGVYMLEGDDDAGSPIVASFATGNLTLPSEKDPGQAGALKRLAAVYLGVASDQSLYMKIVSGGQEFMYVSRTSNANMMQQRVDPGRGLRSTYYSFEVYNSQGSDFDLESIEFIPIKLSRRIGCWASPYGCG